MADGFLTTVEEMQRAGAHVFSVNDTVQADLATLRSTLAPLAGAWRGEAATAFAGLMARWDTNARALAEALRSIGEAIQSSGRTYQAQEEQQAAALSSISAALG